MTLYGCVGIALSYITKGEAKFKLEHPTGGIPEAVLKGMAIDAFAVEILHEPLSVIPNGAKTSAFQEIVTNVISPIFVNYYENQIPWLQAKAGTTRTGGRMSGISRAW